MNTFKDGDLVYFPTHTTELCILKYTEGIDALRLYLLSDAFKFQSHISLLYFDGKLFDSHKVPSIFHATEENKESLENLYGTKFDKCVTKLYRLLSQDKNVLCYVSNDEFDLSDLSRCEISIIRSKTERGEYEDYFCRKWYYAVPVENTIDFVTG